MDVQVSIDGIILYCDESASNISLGNGYSIKKKRLDDWPHKSRIVDGNERILTSYLGSRMIEDDTVCFMCLQKTDTQQISLQMNPTNGILVITDSTLSCEGPLSEYRRIEMEHLHKQFSLLRVFKAGNIGYKDIFITQQFKRGILTNTDTNIINNASKNIVDNRIYTLTTNEIAECNRFLQEYGGKEYILLEDCIQEFVFGLEQIDTPTGFEQFTTALEMLFLKKNQTNKKQALSKRVAVLLGKTPTEVTSLYTKMLSYYRYRSESLHEGNGKNITASELIELEDITRKALQEFLRLCKLRVQQKQNVTWQEIKVGQISDLRKQVGLAIKAGVLPEGNDTLCETIKVWLKKIFKK